MPDAVQMARLTRPIFYREVKKLDVSINEDGNKKRVDVSELIRVFGNDFKINQDVSKGTWEKSMKVLEQRIANQEKAAKEREEVEQKILDENRRLKKAYSHQKKALESEKNKSLWQKLFG